MRDLAKYGKIDALLPRINVKAPNHAIIELKYIPKERFTEKLLQEKISEAEAQLSRYATSQELVQVPNLQSILAPHVGKTFANFKNKFFQV